MLRVCTSVLLFMNFTNLQHAVTTEGKTLLPHYLGMYRLTVNNTETYWMVMRNVLSSSVTTNRKFDLKGSTVDRAATHKEKVHYTVSNPLCTCVYKEFYSKAISNGYTMPRPPLFLKKGSFPRWSSNPRQCLVCECLCL